MINFGIPKDKYEYLLKISRIGREQRGIVLNLIEEENNIEQENLFDIAREFNFQTKNYDLFRDKITGKFRQIFIDNLCNITISINDIQNYFSKFGKIEKIDLVNLLHSPCDKDVGRIVFENSEGAKKAIRLIDNNPFPFEKYRSISVKKDFFDFALYQIYEFQIQENYKIIHGVEKIILRESESGLRSESKSSGSPLSSSFSSSQLPSESIFKSPFDTKEQTKSPLTNLTPFTDVIQEKGSSNLFSSPSNLLPVPSFKSIFDTTPNPFSKTINDTNEINSTQETVEITRNGVSEGIIQVKRKMFEDLNL